MFLAVTFSVSICVFFFCILCLAAFFMFFFLVFVFCLVKAVAVVICILWKSNREREQSCLLQPAIRYVAVKPIINVVINNGMYCKGHIIINNTSLQRPAFYKQSECDIFLVKRK